MIDIDLKNTKSKKLVEVWVPINGAPDYFLSNYGRVRSEKYASHKILKPTISKTGYYRYCLRVCGFNDHRIAHIMVASHFIGPRPSGLVIDHIDTNRLNNCVNNLRYITSRENIARSYTGVTSKYTGVCWHKASRKWVAQIQNKSKVIYIGGFCNELDASRAYKERLKEITNGQ